MMKWASTSSANAFNNLPPNLLGAAHAGYGVISMLPVDARNLVLSKYVDALRIIFFTSVPVAGIGLILSLFVTNKKLQHTGPAAPVEA